MGKAFWSVSWFSMLHAQSLTKLQTPYTPYVGASCRISGNSSCVQVCRPYITNDTGLLVTATLGT